MERAGAAMLDGLLGPADAPADLAAVVRRFVDAVRGGSYLLAGEAGVRPHQLMDACARSPRLRDRYARIVGDVLSRLTRAVEGGQRQGLVRKDVAAEDVAALLFAGVLGAQTMLELRLPLDLPRAASATMRLVMAGAKTAT
jgi:AcrR family transcriptional regulator